MSEDTADVIRSLFAALEQDDFATALELFDPEVEWSPTEGRYRGVEGVGAAFIEWMEPWDEHHIELEEVIETADDRVLVTIRLTGRGGRSGMEIDQRFFQLYSSADGRITRMVEYVDRDRALEAAELR